jgi:hypothetical protein
MNEALASEIKLYAAGRRETEREKELLHLLRQEPEEDRYEIIQGVLSIRHLLGLLFARKCLSKPKYFNAILIEGIQIADAHGIQFWLECTVAPLGMKRVLYILEEMVKVNPVGVEKVLYHLPAYLSPNATNTRFRIQRLRQTQENQSFIR